MEGLTHQFVNLETDVTARGENFQNFAKQLLLVLDFSLQSL